MSAETGPVRGGTPWMKAALDDAHHRYPDEMAAAEAEIPDGMHVSLTCGSRPRPLGAVLIDDRTRTEVARVRPGSHSVMAAVYSVLAASKVAV